VNHQLPCDRPNFHQALPSDRNWTLLTDDGKRAGQLEYADDEGVRIIVPNIWYNQPVAWRIEFYLFCIVQSEARLDFHEHRNKDRNAVHFASEERRQLDRLRQLVKKMETTGKVLA
jgi:hypothetical protein